MAKWTLDELVTQLQAAFGDDLTSVVLYGSAAGGEHNPKRSDHNVLVIVRAVPMAAARAISATARAWAIFTASMSTPTTERAGSASAR